ncbi:MAG: RsmB/NOP family class I SAM-dependent RNA methyltransferase [Clostridiales bacterium]|nr:RsmB/NOP family class I SAM-dependent RNA methyltransferase [Clostridiales bacterium]
MKLPEEFKSQMKELLKDEYGEYLRTFDDERVYGLRANTLKISPEEFKKTMPFELEAVEWAEGGYYYKYNENMRPGQNAFYHAGLYYIQEPSAMYPANVLAAKPGDRVLDICAAPGGKSVQIGTALKGKGLLISNDISGERVKALVKNIEMAGIVNALVTNEAPGKLADKFPDYFDKILVDAPCSGEGMFRKDDEAVKSWQNYKSSQCRELQDSILECAGRMLKPGGKLVYSTCTFNMLENEQAIGAFLNRHSDYKMADVPKTGGIANGFGEFKKAARLWPHKLRGEGHFTAALIKTGTGTGHFYPPPKSVKLLKEAPEALKSFFDENLEMEAPHGNFVQMGERLFFLPDDVPTVDGLKIAGMGLFLGELSGKKGFKQSHQLALALKETCFKRRLCLAADDFNLQRYLKGETVSVGQYGCSDGLTAVCVEKYPLGWGVVSSGTVKNLYPKGWRRMN